MIQAFRRKLRSQRGASMLLALLFLALCTMVAASILMASAANAGKHRSNLTEHQQYLALSSAVSLLCDELSAAEYRAQYTCWTTTEDGGKDEDGNPITYTSYHFNQESGYYSGTLSSILQKISMPFLPRPSIPPRPCRAIPQKVSCPQTSLQHTP